MRACHECGAAPTILFGHAPKAVHTPSCSQGRCGATNKFAPGGLATRCVTKGKDNHGSKHIDAGGVQWDGKWISVDQALEERDY